jgi:hypothetical protein
MFVSDEVLVTASFAAASKRMSTLVDGAALAHASREAWGEGLANVGLDGPIPGSSELIHVQFRELVQRGGVAVLTLRWQAEDAAGDLFPALDADLTLAPHGESSTLLGLDGVYRLPAGIRQAVPDSTLLNRVATATARALLNRLAEVIADAAGNHAGTTIDGRAPDSLGPRRPRAESRDP